MHSSGLAIRALILLVLIGCGSGGTTLVGEEGGVIELDGLRLTIPPGALRTSVEIVIRETDEMAPEGWRALSPVFEFEPSGLSFAVPVELRMRVTEPGTIQWMESLDGTVEILPTTTEGEWLVAPIEHFSFGFGGVPATGDAGIDASVDGDAADSTVASSDVGDSSADAGDLDCWVEQVMDPDPTMDSAEIPLVASDIVEGRDGTLYQVRLSALYAWNGVEWSRTDLSLAAGLGVAPEDFRGASLAVDDAGDLHALLHARGRIAQPNPFYLRREGDSWTVEDVYATAPSELGMGVCYSDYTQKSNISIESDGTMHALFDCAWHADARRYRPIMYCIRTDDAWSCSLMDGPLIGEPGAARPHLLRGAGALHVYYERTVDLLRDPSPPDAFSLNHYRTIEGGAFAAGPVIDEYCPGTGCVFATPEEVRSESGSLLLVGDHPVVYYPYVVGWDPRVAGPPGTLLRRAELVEGAFVVREILDHVSIESNAVHLADGRELILLRGQELEGGVPGFRSNADVRLAVVGTEVGEQFVTWPGLNESTAQIQPQVTLFAHSDGTVHGTYLGNDDVLHHVRTCPGP